MDSRTALLNASRLRRRIVALLAPALVADGLAAAAALGAYASLAPAPRRSPRSGAATSAGCR